MKNLQNSQNHSLRDFKKGESKLLFSTVTQEELALAPDQVKILVENIKKEKRAPAYS